jgi:transcriptional regulator with XRE-family HTH domain
MGNCRGRQKLLPAKLLAIREFLNVGQADMATTLQFEILSHCLRHYQIKPARVSEFEQGKREPNLFVLAAYARLGHVHMESIVDDDVIIDQFRTRLGKEFDYSTLSQRAQKKSNKRVSAPKKIAPRSPARLGDYIRTIRTNKSLSLLDVSKRSARFGRPIAASYINRLERNSKLNPSLDRLAALALGLGVTVDELFAHAVKKMSPDEADELSLVARFRELSPQRKADLWSFIELWHSREASKEPPEVP